MAPDPLDLAPHSTPLPFPAQDEGGAVGGAEMPEIPLLNPPPTQAGVPYGPDKQPGPSVLAPLCQVPLGNQLAYIHSPFTTNDLFNWQESLSSYQEAPQQYVELVQWIIDTHKSTVPDLFTLLSSFLVMED